MKDFFLPGDANYFVAVEPGQNVSEYRKYISLEKANELLRKRGKVVYGKKNHYGLLEICEYSNPEDGPSTCDTHQALLINIEEIEEDSAHKIAEDLAGVSFGAQPGTSIKGLIERAKKLLAKESK